MQFDFKYVRKYISLQKKGKNTFKYFLQLFMAFGSMVGFYFIILVLHFYHFLKIIFFYDQNKDYFVKEKEFLSV